MTVGLRAESLHPMSVRARRRFRASRIRISFVSHAGLGVLLMMEWSSTECSIEDIKPHALNDMFTSWDY